MGIVWYWMPRYQSLPASHRPVPYPYRDLHLPLRLRPHVRDRPVSPPHTHSISLDRTPTSACDWSGRGPAGHEILSPVARCTNAHTKCIQNGDSPPPLSPSLPRTRRVEDRKRKKDSVRPAGGAEREEGSKERTRSNTKDTKHINGCSQVQRARPQGRPRSAQQQAWPRRRRRARRHRLHAGTNSEPRLRRCCGNKKKKM